MNQATQTGAKEMQSGLLTQLHESFSSQLYNIGNTICCIENQISKIRNVQSPEEAANGKLIKEPYDLYEKFESVNNQLEVFYKRLTKVNENLTNII